MNEPQAIEAMQHAPPFGGVVELIVGKDALQSHPPRRGSDVTSGFAALDQLRAQHNGWSEENPPRLERVAHVVKF